MQCTSARTGSILPILAWVLIATATCYGQEPSKDQPKNTGAEKPTAKADPAVIAKLIEQLGSDDFNTREKASGELAKLDEVPDALRDAARSGDPEVVGRARRAIAIITARLDDREFHAIAAEMDKVQLDRFVRRMVTDKKFAGDKYWEIIHRLSKTVAQRAAKLGDVKCNLPEFDIANMPLMELAVERLDYQNRRLLVNNTGPMNNGVDNCIVLCTGRMPYVVTLRNSILIVDGEFGGATTVENSLVIVRGHIASITGVQDSIILATGNFEGATVCENSFVQVNNHQIWFDQAKGSTFIKTIVQLRAGGETTWKTLETDKGLLQHLKFSPRPTDAQLSWGKEVNHLAVAIAPADQKDHYLIRWKNMGKTPLEVPWTRLKSDMRHENRDDLTDHVFLKDAAGNPAATKKHQPGPVDDGEPIDRYVTLGPGQTHDEVIDLWQYVNRPGAAGRYQLSIELEIRDRRPSWGTDVPFWIGTIRSNILEVSLGK